MGVFFLSRCGFALAALLLAGCSNENDAASSGVSVSNRPNTSPSGLATDSQKQPVEINQAEFQAWLQGMRRDALQAGISAKTVNTVLANATPVPRVIELDRAQPEFTSTFGSYLTKSVTDKRVQQGQALLRQHAALLSQIEQKYGVQPRFLVSFWGMETNFGGNYGSFSVVNALATLAFEGRRAAFFRKELLDALSIIDAGHIAPNKMLGSWAGAMGNVQFMPSTFRAHAVDGDGDGRIDIWNSLPDTFASAARYLADIGWRGNQTWGREVRLPTNFNYDLADTAVRKSISEWKALGVTLADGRPLSMTDTARDTSIVVPSGASGPAFIVYDNFRATMQWNKSVNYALAVGVLADRFVGEGRLVVSPADTKGLRRTEVQEIQQGLATLGYDVGSTDGVVGGKTRTAIKSFQNAQGVPADGYIDQTLLQSLRQATARNRR